MREAFTYLRSALAPLGFKRTSKVTGPLDGEIPRRSLLSRTVGAFRVNEDTALKHSGVWACLRLRADLMSTFPVEVYRDVNQIPAEVSKPPVLVAPGGEHWSYIQWMWATQFDLDRCGNAVGLITERDGGNRPSRIDLCYAGDVKIIQKESGEVRYRIGKKEYTRDKVWHERQFTVGGLAAGLSPIAYAASSIGEHMSMLQFALDWFGGSGIPRARLKNTSKVLNPKEARVMKDRYNATIANGDLFVHGSDWEFDLLASETAGQEFIEGRKYGLGDVARFFGAPLDLIEASIQGTGGQINYANITQRHLQFLILNMNPAIVRREEALSGLLTRPRYVKLNADALLRMDPIQRATYLKAMIDARLMTNTEAREKDNRRPLTEAEIAEFEKIYGPPKSAQPAAAPGQPGDPGADKPTDPPA